MFINNHRMYNKRLFLFWIGSALLLLLLSLPSQAQHSRLGEKPTWLTATITGV